MHIIRFKRGLPCGMLGREQVRVLCTLARNGEMCVPCKMIGEGHVLLCTGLQISGLVLLY
jgi:hypothetical protein